MESRNFVWATPVCDFCLEGNIIQAAADISYGPTALLNGVLRFDTDGGVNTYNLYVDNVIARNFRATEPAFGIWGSETTKPG
jgi:hypothetical protein